MTAWIAQHDRRDPYIHNTSPAKILPAGVKAEAVTPSFFIVSATYSRLLAVYSCVSGFVQNAHSNLSHWLHALSKSQVLSLTGQNLEENLVHELPRNSVIGAQIDE